MTESRRLSPRMLSVLRHAAVPGRIVRTDTFEYVASHVNGNQLHVTDTIYALESRGLIELSRSGRVAVTDAGQKVLRAASR